MKSGSAAVALAALVMVGGIAYAFIQNGDKLHSPPVPETMQTGVDSAIVQVDDLASHPDKHPGEIVLRAVVAGVNEREGVLSVIDHREFEACGVLTCAKIHVPVMLQGELPIPGTVVELTGEVVNGDKGLVFAARRLKRIP